MNSSTVKTIVIVYALIILTSVFIVLFSLYKRDADECNKIGEALHIQTHYVSEKCTAEIK
jgi:hypothetical protein